MLSSFVLLPTFLNQPHRRQKTHDELLDDNNERTYIIQILVASNVSIVIHGRECQEWEVDLETNEFGASQDVLIPAGV